MKIRYKLSLPVTGAILLFFVCIQFFIITGLRKYEDYVISTQKESLIIGYEKELQSATEIAVSIVQSIYKKSDLSDGEKLDLAGELIRPIRFGVDGYFYVYHKGNGVNLIHGLNSANEGKNLWNLQSPDKKQYFIRELDKTADNGSIFLEFFWSKPGEDSSSFFPKLGTAMMVPGTDIWLGTGAYIDEIDKVMDKNSQLLITRSNQLIKTLMIIMIIAIILLFLLVIFLIHGVVAPVVELSKIAEESKGTDFSVTPEFTKRRFPDEITVLEDSFKILISNFSSVINGVQQAVKSSMDSSSKMESSIKDITESINESELSLQDIAAAEKQLSTEADVNLKTSIELKEFVENSKALAVEQSVNVNEAAYSINEMQKDISLIDKGTNEYYNLIKELEDKARNGYQSINKAVKNLEETDIAAGSINEAINLISDLTERTNVLAINASIEAARAGFVGKGFGVIAHEIRALAENSRKNMEVIELQLKEIATSVKESKESTTLAESTFTQIQAMSKDALTGTEVIASNSRSIGRKSSEVDGILTKLVRSADETKVSSIKAFEHVGVMEESASELSQLALNLLKTVENVKAGYKQISKQSSSIQDESIINIRKMDRLNDSVSIFKTMEESRANTQDSH